MPTQTMACRGGGDCGGERSTELPGVPADIGNWGLLQIFQEAGRLLSQCFWIFLPIIITCILPASLIKVLHTQFIPGDFVPADTQGSTEQAESKFEFVGQLFWSMVFALPQLFILLGASLMFSSLTNVIYSKSQVKTTWHEESLHHSINLALIIKDVETENPVLRTTTTDHSLYNRFRRTSKGKKLRAFAAIFLCLLVYIVISTTGVNFTPEAIAKMGLPPWTLFLFTLLITFLMTVSTSYVILVYLVLFVWLCSPSCGVESGLCGIDEHTPGLR